MNKAEFEVWKQHTETSKNKWILDHIHDGVHSNTYLFYRGGVDGKFIQIDKDVEGIVTAKIGNYEGAIPHIGEASFKTVYSNEFGSTNDAFLALVHRGGLTFLKDFITVDESGLF